MSIDKKTKNKKKADQNLFFFRTRSKFSNFRIFENVTLETRDFFHFIHLICFHDLDLPFLHMKQAAPRSSQGSRNQAPVDSTNTVVNQVFRLALFDHLPRKQIPKDPDSVEEDRNLHLATIQLGLLFNKGLIQADDDRVEAMVRAFVKIIEDYKTPPKKVLREDLDKYIAKQVMQPFVFLSF
jgi:hypothetical protein